MSTQNSNKAPADNLLTPQEYAACQSIATGKSLYSQRAKALLALDGGATQAQAGQQAGLTLSQVTYWLGKFRRERLQAFPEDALTVAQSESQVPDVEASEELEPAAQGTQVDQPEKKSKQSKKKKSKRTKKKAKKSKQKKDKKKKKSKKKSKK